MATIQKASTLEIRRIAVELECDPRSVSRVLRGESVRGIVGEKIVQALRAKGLIGAEQGRET